MAGSEKALGIVAGGGELPIAIARTAQAKGRKVFLLALKGAAEEEDVQPFPHAFVSLGELGKAVELLNQAKCSEITFAGAVARLNFHQLKMDARGALALPKVIAAARGGDDALLRAILSLFEKEGFRVIGSGEAARELLAPEGLLGTCRPTEDDRADIAAGAQVVRALGAFDVGQAVAVCDGLVLAVEAAEGTNAMLARVATLPEALRGSEKQRRGVLVKAPKPDQERRVDLPVIGERTVQLAGAAGLSGIAVQAGAALIMDRPAVVAAAEAAGLFVLGFGAEEFPE